MTSTLLILYLLRLLTKDLYRDLAVELKISYQVLLLDTRGALRIELGSVLTVVQKDPSEKIDLLTQEANSIKRFI